MAMLGPEFLRRLVFIVFLDFVEPHEVEAFLLQRGSTPRLPPAASGLWH